MSLGVHVMSRSVAFCKYKKRVSSSSAEDVERARRQLTPNLYKVQKRKNDTCGETVCEERGRH